MKKRKKIASVFIILVIVLSVHFILVAANQQGKQDGDLNTLIALCGALLGLIGIIFGIYQYLRRMKDTRKRIRIEHEEKKRIIDEERRIRSQGAREQYCETLREKTKSMRMTGPEFESQPVPLEEAFVSLRLSQAWRCDNRFEKRKVESPTAFEDSYLSPERVMEVAFERCRLLLVIGDPGSGKTTLLHYYSLMCLDNKHRQLGFKEDDILPLYLPIRDIEFSEKGPKSLQENLSTWAENQQLTISAKEFEAWLEKPTTLVLLDGLDEISDTERRRQVCRWVEKAWARFGKAKFVLTSRPTGFRKVEGFDIECDHLRADIMDFTPQQQERFLMRWFKAAYVSELPGNASQSKRERKEQEGERRAKKIISFLNREENRGIRELARVPMLLQIMALLWKERDFLPGSRCSLYDISLNYLLDFRDRRRDLKPILAAAEARQVLEPTALWMQEEQRSDHAAREDVHAFMETHLREMHNQPKPLEFCTNLIERAGLLAEYGDDSYIFRHRTFMEFLAANRLLLECREDPDRIGLLIDSFKDAWWEESLLFFFGKSDGGLFDRFMGQFFKSEVSKHLDANQQNLLQNLVREAPQKRIDSLVKCLNNEDLNADQVRYILDCLKTIGTPESIEAVESFMAEGKASEASLEYAEDILAEFTRVEVGTREALIEEQLKETADSFRNPFEDNVEYIKIPGGSYKFSVTNSIETVPDLFFCKTMVTNKRYRRFVSYLDGSEKELLDILPLKTFSGKLLEFSRTVKGFSDYLGKKVEEWHDKLRSRYDDDKRFNGEDQPVVGVSWYGARSYCFWLSCLDEALKNGGKLPDAGTLAVMFRLPTEAEWEWAAAGREPDGTLRKYPWPKDRGEPNPDLANYGENVGVTTPVGRYPQGATPEGLLDMAGNAWEWMGNYYKVDWLALRGGSWYNEASSLCCAMRDHDFPDDFWDYIVGFRVLRPNL